MERGKESVGNQNNEGDKTREATSLTKEEIGKIATDLVSNFDEVATTDNGLEERWRNWMGKEKERTAKELDYWADEYRNIERAFSKKQQKMNLKEYEKWENDASDAFHKVKDLEPKMEFESRYKRDSAEKLAAISGEDSVEAYAGNFYDERNSAIVKAIEASDNKDQRKDIDTVITLHQVVAEYINAVLDKDFRRIDPQSYHDIRASRHNDVINRINDINHLAEKYGAKRLIFRDFETNNFHYSQSLDPSGETNARAEYDRSSVESYIRTAFSRDFQDSKRSDANYDPNQSLVAQFHNKD